MSVKLAISLVAGAIILGGCAAAVDGRATAREAASEAAWPPTGRILTVDGKRVHAHVEGSGPDLVLIHGASGNTRDFTFALSKRLAREFRVIAFDRPGLGYSDDLDKDGQSPVAQADHLRAAARQLGVRRPIVLGHSYGGAVAMAWALRDPETRGVVSVSGATMPWPGGLGAWYSLTGSAVGGATVVPLISAYASLDRAEGLVARIFAPAAVPEGYVDYVGPGLSLRRDSLRNNSRQVGNLKPYLEAMAPDYPKLTLPVEIIHGTADSIVPHLVHAVPLSERLPNARLTLIEGAGHMPHHSHPDAVIEAVRRLARR
ncbi:MAG: alpha/beta fold hydrolase [Gemmobacter sp.]